VTKVLEDARAKKIIGHSLDADVALCIKDELLREVKPYENELRTIFIVSKASVIEQDKKSDGFVNSGIEGLSIKVTRALGEKCERCWIHDVSVGKSEECPGVCSRCQRTLKSIKDEK
jgi:isoleucyl-tRNA synthetase